MLDAWVTSQKEPMLTRPEAMRRLIELGLKASDREVKSDSSRR
jgi:hypothetical protein